MFSKIAVASDLSNESDQMISELDGLRALNTREIVLMHCVDIVDMGTPSLGTLRDQLLEMARQKLDQQQNMLRDAGFEVSTNLVFGRTELEINRLADEHDCSLIAVGSPGSLKDDIFLGGVASKVIHSARLPVLILRTAAERGKDKKSGKKESGLFRRILFPTDFSDNAERAFAYAVKLAECGAKRFTLIHVQDQSRIDTHLKDRIDEFNKIDTARLERLKEDLEKHGAGSVRVELPYGSPKEEILSLTRNDDVSLVVMGSQGRGYLGEIFLGGVSHAVARHSAASVLLVPAMR